MQNLETETARQVECKKPESKAKIWAIGFLNGIVESYFQTHLASSPLQ